MVLGARSWKTGALCCFRKKFRSSGTNLQIKNSSGTSQKRQFMHKEEQSQLSLVFSKSYKIPIAIKKQFIDHVENGYTIKKAAEKYRLNYSTGRMLYKRYKNEKREYLESAQGLKFSGDANDQGVTKNSKKKNQMTGCSYIIMEEDKEQVRLCSQNCQKRNRLTVISTIAWNFMQDGIPPCRDTSKEI